MIAAAEPTRLTRPALWLMLMIPLMGAGVAVSAAAVGALAWQAGGMLLVICLLAIWVLWRGAPGKYPVLCLCLVGWLLVLRMGAALVPGLAGMALAMGGALVLGIVVFQAALPWPKARAARLCARGRATVEWEWVHVPRVFARAHPLYRLGPGIYLTAVALGASALFAVVLSGWHPAVIWTYAIFLAVTVLFMAVKGAVAYPLVFLGLLPGLPFTLPFIVYWADGVRPNLIYRHRFERLCQEETGNV